MKKVIKRVISMVYKDFNIKKYTTKPIFSEIIINILFIISFQNWKLYFIKIIQV